MNMHNSYHTPRITERSTVEKLYPWIPTIVGHIDLTLSDFYDKYRTSTYGQWHATQPPRFSQTFPYDTVQMYEDLGRDIDPVEHSWYTLENITLPFIDAQQKDGRPYTQKEIMLLVLSTLLHDIGECTSPALREQGLKPVGDIAALEKTRQNIVDEERVLRHIAREIWPELPQAILDECCRIIFGGHSLSEDFNIIERIGYFTTGIRAGHVLYESSGDELHLKNWDHLPLNELTRRNALGALATRVCHTLVKIPRRHGNHYQTLVENRDKYPYVAVILDKHSEFAQRFITGENNPYGSVTKRALLKATEALKATRQEGLTVE